MRPPFESFKGPTCKGSYALGSACGTCEKCAWERSQMAGVLQSFEGHPPTLEQRARTFLRGLHDIDIRAEWVHLPTTRLLGVMMAFAEANQLYQEAMLNNMMESLRDLTNRTLPKITMPKVHECAEALIGEMEVREKRLRDALAKYRGVRDGHGIVSADAALNDKEGTDDRS